MRKELSTIDLHFLVKELKQAEGCVIGKFFHPEKKKLFIEIYKKEIGRRFLSYFHPFFWLGSRKASSEAPSNFCSFLRKYYERAKVISINQVCSERIIELLLQKEKKGKIYFELFGQGNVIICDENNTILYPLEAQEWPDRKIAQREKYDWFSKNRNIFECSDLLNLEIKENISKTLATGIGLGGLFAEELCMRSKIETKSESVTLKQKKLLHTEFFKLLKEPLNPQLVYKNNQLIDITPIKLVKYSDCENKSIDSFSKALEETFFVVKEEKTENKRIPQLMQRIEIQEKSLDEFKKKISECNKKAEFIYQNYEKIEDLLKKGNRVLKSNIIIEGIKIDRKNRKIIVDV